jgi:hypothetical protein
VAATELFDMVLMLKSQSGFLENQVILLCDKLSEAVAEITALFLLEL